MKNSWSVLPILLGLALPLGGCQAIADIFRAGMAVGVILVVVVVGLIVWLVTRAAS